MKIKTPAKYICIFIAAAAIFILCTAMAGCEKPDSLTLAERILDGTQTKPVYMNSTITILPNKKILNDYSSDYFILSSTGIDMFPDKIDVRIKGTVIPTPSPIFDLIAVIDGNDDMSFKILSDGKFIYVELNKYSRVISDLIRALGYVGSDYYTLFISHMDFNSGKYLRFDLKTVDLEYFSTYAEYTDLVAAVSSKTEYTDAKALSVPVISEEFCIDFTTVKKKVLVDSYKLDGRKFMTLNCIISSEDGKYYLNVLGETEREQYVRLEKLELKCKLDSMERSEYAFMQGKYVPLRFIAELIGKDILWDAENKFAYTYSETDGSMIKFDGMLVEGTTYVRLVEFLKFTDMQLYTESVDAEFIEFIIYRLDY